MAVVLAQHNLPLAIMDHLSPLFRDIFPDSNVAKSFSAQARRKDLESGQANAEWLTHKYARLTIITQYNYWSIYTI